nr:uncharacterized protein LOC128671545 isoform X2 [Plodia interpunctella]
MKFYHKTFKKMLFFILLSVLVTESLGIECSKDRSGRPDPNAIPFSIGNFKLQAGYINWQITYILPRIHTSSVLINDRAYVLMIYLAILEKIAVPIGTSSAKANLPKLRSGDQSV